MGTQLGTPLEGEEGEGRGGRGGEGEENRVTDEIGKVWTGLQSSEH